MTVARKTIRGRLTTLTEAQVQAGARVTLSAVEVLDDGTTRDIGRVADLAGHVLMVADDTRSLTKEDGSFTFENVPVTDSTETSPTGFALQLTTVSAGEVLEQVVFLLPASDPDEQWVDELAAMGDTPLTPTYPQLVNEAVAALAAIPGTITATLTDNNSAATAVIVGRINAAITALVNGAPGALDTLKEISDQLGADESAAAAILTALNSHKNDHTNPHAVTKAQVGLGSVDNTSDMAKPVSTAQAAAIATAISNLVAGAPGALDTLNELAVQLGSDENAAGALTTLVAGIRGLSDSTFLTGLNNAFAGRWQGTHAYVSGDLALAPDGTIIQRNADGTSRASYDTTEQATWTVKAGSTAKALTDVATVATADGALTVSKHNPVDATSGRRTMTLADAASAGLVVAVSKKDATANTVTVSATHLRDGGAGSISLVGQHESLLLVSKADGSWWPVGDHKTKAYLDGAYARLALDSTQRLMAGLRNETRDMSVLTIGDSTGNEDTEWIRLWTNSLSADWPAWTVLYYLWDDTAGAYAAPVTVHTGSGARTLSIYNASVAGFSTTSWRFSRAETAIYALDPTLVMISLGHNEGTTTTLWHSLYLSLTESVTERLPGADVICIAQNTHTVDTTPQQRAEVYREIAARRGFGFIDVGQAFTDTGDVASYTLSANIHPNSAGSILWAATVYAAFVYQKGRALRTQPPSTLSVAGESLAVNGDFADWTGVAPTSWTLSNATMSKNTTDYESANGYSALITGTISGGFIKQDLPISRVKGRWVTFGVRQYVPADQTTGVGRIGIIDSTGSLIHSSAPRGGWSWTFITKFVPATATSCRVQIYADTGGTGHHSVDRVVVKLGKYPSGVANAQRGLQGTAGLNTVTQVDHLSTISASNPMITALAYASAGTMGVSGANQGVFTPFIPARNMTLNFFEWLYSAVGGNYDMGIYDAAGNRLWSKGSTAWPGSGTITETVSPGLALTAGTTYYFAFSSDTTAGRLRALLGGAANFMKHLDGTGHVRVVSSMFPLPSTVALGTVYGSSIPLIVFREA